MVLGEKHGTNYLPYTYFQTQQTFQGYLQYPDRE